MNASQKAGSGNMGNYTVYVNSSLVLRSGGYTKHYYIGSQRIVSKLGSGWDDSGKGPLETTKAGEDKVNYESKHQQLSDAIVKNLKFLGQDGAILTAGKSGKVPPGQLNSKGTGGGGGSEPSTSTVESFQYYYHPDHLGSTSYITDASGEVYQHLEYFAFGETFVEEHSNTNRTPFLYNGKELDEETGLYYYGARYYDARTSIWASVDPLAGNHPNFTPYNYVLNNPVRFIDPMGLDTALYALNSGALLDTKKSNSAKTPIWTVDETAQNYDPKNPWATAKPLKYSVGKGTPANGITGKSFTDGHPLKGVGTKVGSQVYREDLMDLGNEFLRLVKSGISDFEGKGLSFNEFSNLVVVQKTGC